MSYQPDRCRIQDRRFALAPRRMLRLLNRFAGIVFRRYKNVLRAESRCVWHECAEFWHKQNVSTFRTSFWRAVDGGSGPISVLGNARRSYRSPSEYSLTRTTRPPLFGELSCLKADRSYRGRESCHLKYINSLISRVVIVGFGLHERTYMLSKKKPSSRFYCRRQDRGARISD